MTDEQEILPVPRGQPTVDELKALAQSGLAVVVNLRRDGEPDQPISPEEEGRIVHSLGMGYLHVPVGGAPITRSEVQTFRDFLLGHPPSSVMVHCKSGGRAVLMMLLAKAETEGWPAEEVVERGRQIGLNVPAPLVPIVVQYLEQRT